MVNGHTQEAKSLVVIVITVYNISKLEMLWN
jgi:hypothetical protein